MAKFSYTAQKNDGEEYKGVAEAADRFALYDIVRHEGGHIISLSEDKKKNLWNKALGLQFTRVKEYDKILFARNLGAMLAAGLSLARALSVMQRQTKNPKLAAVIGELASIVRRGSALHEALAQASHIFPSLFVAMVKAGEESGDLSGALAAIADQMERMYAIKKKIRGALIYPCIILIAILGIGFLMMTQVVPTLAQTFAQMNVTLPLSTRVVIGISNFLVQNTLLTLMFAFIAVVLVSIVMKTAGARHVLDFVLLKTPLIGGIVREVNAARTARTLASLLSSGVDMVAALSITGEVVQNSYFRQVIKEASAGITAGAPLSVAFARREDLYPAFVGEMMAVGEETGQTDEMLKRLAVFYEDEVDRKTKDMSTVIEPFLMILIGAAVGFFAISMITPIYSLSQNL